MGVARLLDLLKNSDIGYFGLSIDGKNDPLDFDIDDFSFSFYGIGGRNMNKRILERYSVNDINEKFPLLKTSNRLNIIMPHWGYEYEHLPLPIHVDLGRKLIKQGFKIVIGSHPHVSQPIEEYENGLIAYSLGNFYFGTRRNNFKLVSDIGTGLIVEFKKNKESFSYELIQIIYSRNREKTGFFRKNGYDNVLDYKIPIDLNDYNKAFSKNRTFPIKPSLYYGQEKKNKLKLKLYKTKTNLMRSFEKLFKIK